MKRMIAMICGAMFLMGLFSTSVIGQSERESVGRNAVYAELFGPGMSLSFNYDVRFGKTNAGWGARVGVGGFKFGDTDILTLPVGINYLLGDESKFFEFGINGVYSSKGFFFTDDEDAGQVLGMLTLGFRRQLPGKGFHFRASLNPVFGIDKNDNFNSDGKDEFFFFPFYGGVSMGYSF